MLPFNIKNFSKSNRPALVDVDNNISISYEDIFRKVDSMKSLYEKSGKMLIFLFCQNNVDSVISYLAGLNYGHVLALLDSRLDVSFKVRLISIYKPNMIIDSASGLASSIASISTQYALSQENDLKSDIWIKEGAEHRQFHKDLTLLLSTSGITGSPKLVRLSKSNLQANTAAIIDSLGISSKERTISSLPMHYSYGLSVINTHLATEGSVVLTDESPMSRLFWDIFKIHNCSSFAGVPFTYQMLSRIGFEKFDLPKLNTMSQAGGKLSDSLAHRYYELLDNRGGKFFTMYGQTEATARIACLSPSMLPDKLGSVGQPVGGGQVYIKSGDKEVNKARIAGEVVYYGQNVMMGYATTHEDLLKGDELGGRLNTGDLGFLDEDGFLYITGRIKRIAKVFGVRVSLDEVQMMFEEIEPTVVLEKNGKMVVFCGMENVEKTKRFSRALAARLKIHYSAFQVKGINSIPLKSNGKIDYIRLETLS